MSFRKFGIDISYYQEGINFDLIVRDGVEFVILRAAYHLTEDTQFELFYRQAKERNLPVGAYLYTTAETPMEARREAQFLIDTILKGKQFELPIYIDIEDEIYYNKSRAMNTDIVIAFCETMEASNYFTGVYASTYFFKTYLEDSRLKAYTHWVAQWAKENTYPDKSVLGMWQFGGSINEIRSCFVAGYEVDQDYMYRDFPAIIKGHRLNGFGDKSN